MPYLSTDLKTISGSLWTEFKEHFMKKILVCEDEAAIREFVVLNLQKAGFEVCEAETGEQAMELFEKRGDFDIALLDLMLPGIDGIEVCKRLRSQSDRIGIIMLTARTQEADKISGLSSGADDYMTKPFSPSELVARVNSLCRRMGVGGKNKEEGDGMSHGGYTLNIRRRCLETPEGKSIELTQVEFHIMEYFFSNYGQPIDRSKILSKVWGEEYYGEEKIVDVNIRRLRMKIEDEPSEPKHIITVWGRGYKWIS